MARPLRVEFPAAVYHVTARGNERKAIFRDDEDRDRFLRQLAREVDQHRWRCHAYCLMDNHYHLVLETAEANLARGMRRLNSTYSTSFNRRHERVGHLFQGRYHAVLVEKENYMLAVSRYVVLNPVRAGLVARPADWAWSSYRATAGHQPRPAFLDIGGLLGRFAANPNAARRAYRLFVGEDGAAPSPWENVRGRIWLGSEEFRARMEARLRTKNLVDVPRDQREPTRPTRAQVVQGVLATYGLTEDRLWSREHQEAFRAAAYLLRRVASLPLRDVAALGGVTAPRISRIQREVEKGPRPPRLARLLRRYKVQI